MLSVLPSMGITVPHDPPLKVFVCEFRQRVADLDTTDDEGVIEAQ